MKEKLLETPIFTVNKNTGLYKDFEPISVDAPDWVTMIVTKDNQFLTEIQFRHGTESFIEEFPCGMVEKDEKPFAAALRELEEETGIRLTDIENDIKNNNIRYVGRVSPNPAFMTNHMYYFMFDLDKCKYEQVERKLDAHEDIKCYWVQFRDFLQKLNDDVDEHPAMLYTALHFFLMRDTFYRNLDISKVR